MDNKKLTLLIQGEKSFIPAVLDGVNWTLNRKGTPGKLTFKILQDDILELEEGNIIQASWGDTNFFKGYVFSRSMNKDKTINVTAYDQLRYLKNKDIYEIVNEKANTLIEKIAGDFGLTYKDKDGKSAISDTGYNITRMRASNETLFDIIQTALDHTLVYTGKVFILYDDFGVLSLKELGELDVDILLDSETAQDFSYSSSIDRDTFNQIKLFEDNKEAGKREIFYAKDSTNIKKWGLLQNTEKVNSKRCSNIQKKVDTMLQTYNHARKSLSIKGAFGNIRVRAGSRVWLSLKIEDKDVNLGGEDNKAVQMLVEQVTHHFSNDEYTMDLKLVGRGIS